MSFEERESLDLKDLKQLRENTIKKYNDTQDEDLYNQCLELDKLLEKRELQARIGQLPNYVRCEICNIKVQDTDQAKKEHQEQVHKTWINYKPLSKTEKKKIATDITDPPPMVKTDELGNIIFPTHETFQLDQVEGEPAIDRTVQSKQTNIDVSIKLKKLAEAQRKEDEDLMKTILEGIKAPKKEHVEIKHTDEQIFKEEKKSLFKKREKITEPTPPKEPKPKREFGFPKRRYKRPHFALKGQFPILEVLIKGGPMILLKNADRSLEIIKAKKIQGKFVETHLGFFELDGEFENRFNGMTSYYVHNIHNSKPLSVKAVEEIQRYYRDKDASTIVDEMEKIKNAMKKGEESVDPITAMSTIFKQESKITDMTKKFLIDFITFDKHDIALLVSDRINTKHPKSDISRPIQTMFPILILAAIGIGTMLFMRFFNPLKIFNIPILLGLFT